MNKQVKLNPDGSIKSRGIEWADYDEGWLSGVIDSEGSISLLKERRPAFRAGVTYKPRLNIGNKSIALLQKAQSLIGGGAIIGPNTRGVYNLDVSTNAAFDTLSNLTLIVKDQQRLLLLQAIEILRIRTGRGIGGRTDADIACLEGIYKQIRNLNGRHKDE